MGNYNIPNLQTQVQNITTKFGDISQKVKNQLAEPGQESPAKGELMLMTALLATAKKGASDSTQRVPGTALTTNMGDNRYGNKELGRA